mmetsp:Transcript_24402/g.36603  ORF Transcript_24402/g.36603 Transcript_24402/m.36603 type:complete len:638 (+) Transcript_24402:80-1993(+)
MTKGITSLLLFSIVIGSLLLSFQKLDFRLTKPMTQRGTLRARSQMLQTNRNRFSVRSMEAMTDAEVPQQDPKTVAMDAIKSGKYHTEVLFNDETFYPVRMMQTGVRKLAAVVGCTLGPRGRNVVVQRKVGTRPRIINDGVSIAKEIVLENDLEEIGCQLVREASERTNTEAGDGTTSAIILSDAIITEGIKRVVSGINAMQIYRGMERTCEELVKFLQEEVAINIEDDMLEDVGTISASGNVGIGKMIGNAIKAVGRLGLVILEEGKGVDDILEVQQGMFIDECGYISNKLINKPEDGIVEYENAKVLICDGDINTIEEIIPVMELAFENDWPILVIANSYSKDVENFLVLNQQRAGLKVAAVVAPVFGDLRSNILQDIAILTGSVVVGEDIDTAIPVNKVTADMLGEAVLVEVGREGTLIQGPNNTAAAVDARVESLEDTKEQIYDQDEPAYEIDKINRRIAKLKGGVSVVYVGAMTELELRDRKLRYDDALCAIRSALEEGIVPGGATAYLRLSTKINDIIPTLKPEEQKGAEILQKALEYPLLLVARNAGADGPLVVADVKDGQMEDPRFGWNAATGEFGDMLDMGIIEPAKVIRCALENAVSIAKTFLLTEGVVVHHHFTKQKKEADYGELQM